MNWNELQALKPGDAVGVRPAYASSVTRWRKDNVIGVTKTQITLANGTRFLKRTGAILGSTGSLYREGLASIAITDQHNLHIELSHNHGKMVNRLEEVLNKFKQSRSMAAEFDSLISSMETLMFIERD